MWRRPVDLATMAVHRCEHAPRALLPPWCSALVLLDPLGRSWSNFSSLNVRVFSIFQEGIQLSRLAPASPDIAGIERCRKSKFRHDIGRLITLCIHDVASSVPNSVAILAAETAHLRNHLAMQWMAVITTFDPRSNNDVNVVPPTIMNY